jgi:hypothetical protein
MNIKLEAAIDTAIMLASSVAFVGIVFLGIAYFPKVTIVAVMLLFAAWMYAMNLSDLKIKQMTADLRKKEEELK